jgi:pseudaminic acid synthase
MKIQINDRMIGPGYPVYIVAEMSANHNQRLETALQILEAAKEVGADAVKLQTYTPDTLTIDCNNDHFKIGGTIWKGRTLYELYSEAFTPWDWQPELKTKADELGLDFFSTPFDASAIEFLEKMDVPAYKIASFEIVDLPFLREIASRGKPIIMSTGMATLSEIGEAVRTIREIQPCPLALLKCTSVYPSPPEDMNLKTIPHLSDTFGVPAGLSDHTLDVAVPIAAVALGACIVEKHFTLSRSVPGPDSSFSFEPKEFSDMVKAIRHVEVALGDVSYYPTQKEQASQKFRRSLFVVENMKKGEVFTPKNIRSIRPGNGLHTRYFESVLGRNTKKDIVRGTPLNWDLVV